MKNTIKKRSAGIFCPLRFFYVGIKEASKEENRITLIQEKEECFDERNFVKLKWLLLFSCINYLFRNLPETRTNAFSSQIIQKGAVGDDVIELQARLQNIGLL